MALAKVKEEYKMKRVAFGKSAAPLVEREDIDDLAIIAHESQNPTLLRLFEYLPELSVLKKAKTESELKRPTPVAQTTTRLEKVVNNPKKNRQRKQNTNNK